MDRLLSSIADDNGTLPPFEAAGGSAAHSVPFFSSDFLQHLQQAVDRLYASSLGRGFEYPWHDLDGLLGEGKRIFIAGYGSLMNRSSAARTFRSESVANGCPVVVFSARRVYDYVMSPESRRRFGIEVPDSMCGVLNSYVTGDVRDCFNAVRLELSLDDLAQFRQREFGYDLLPVMTLNWDKLDREFEGEPGIAYILSCRRPHREGRRMTSPDVLPHPSYHELCQDGCREISPAFLDMFHRTTWIKPQFNLPTLTVG